MRYYGSFTTRQRNFQYDLSSSRMGPCSQGETSSASAGFYWSTLEPVRSGTWSGVSSDGQSVSCSYLRLGKVDVSYSLFIKTWKSSIFVVFGTIPFANVYFLISGFPLSWSPSKMDTISYWLWSSRGFFSLLETSKFSKSLCWITFGISLITISPFLGCLFNPSPWDL